ncbi:MAG: hypothetical protein ALECFALPRED_003673 [Alectoria fallacina]|uniref:Uncharacterized protein n=1 Tax=Alectoria fallacina TaxID=1903189 RepID=A0A8H3FJT8_9LECA|nr:MAG: hypothetical protein ALECFALPRED_003673 [Alectoria fallacina]
MPRGTWINVCLYAGCEASFSTWELLKEHGGAHALWHTSRLARNDLNVDIACNNDPAAASKSDSYTLLFPSAVGSSEGHVGTLSEYSGLPYSVGDHIIANDYNKNNYAPCAPTTTRAQGPPATDLPNKHIAAPFDWPGPFRSVEDPVSHTRPQDFCKGPLDLTHPGFAECGNKQPPAAHWHPSNPSSYTEHLLATNATSTGNNTPSHHGTRPLTPINNP